MDDYRLFVNKDRTVLVTLWPVTSAERARGVPQMVEVATREHSDAIWGPPVVLREEKR
jgi:hypothetical protein